MVCVLFEQYAPFKEGNKGSLAERAKAVGLELTAKAILDGMHVDLSTLLNPCKKGITFQFWFF